MTPKFISFVARLLILVAALAFLPCGVAQTGAFTYQGQLKEGGNPANGSYDLLFTLFTTNSGGTAVGGSVTNSGTLVTNGLFMTVLDFGANDFDGSARWLEIGVRQGTNAFIALSPRQQITPAPEALFARNANSLRAGRNWIFPIPYTTASIGSFTDVAQFAFQGTAQGDHIKSANVLARSSNVSTTGEFRLVDVSSGLTIVSGTTVYEASPTVASSGAVTNLPATPTALTLQVRRATGTGSVTFYQFWAE